MSLWNQCLERLRQELPTQQFSMWIRPLVCEEQGGVVALYAPNRFVLDWVRDKYLNNITALLREFAGNDAPQLRLEVMSRNSVSRSQTVSSSASTPSNANSGVNNSHFNANVQSQDNSASCSSLNSGSNSGNTQQKSYHQPSS